MLLNLLHDMVLRRPLYYFMAPRMVMAAVRIAMELDFLRTFYHGGNLSFGLTLLMIMLTLVGSFMAFTRIVLHSISRVIAQSIKKLHISGKLRPKLVHSELLAYRNRSDSGILAMDN